jgi:glycosyltransferase involved in cell wall biosynthesis
VVATLTLAVCAHQAQDCIGACLDSVRRQTLPPDEVIVCVHEMSDPTVAVAQSYGARVIASHGTGLFESRNAVLAACTTDYLAFTDADCVLVPEWVAVAKEVLDAHPEAAAGTGRHPPAGPPTFASWVHHMWFLVETRATGETDGVIGGNSYFRVDALRRIGGWLHLPGHSNAEDVYISMTLRRAGFKIWFDERAAAQHRYEPGFWNLMQKSVRMGAGIVVMMRAAGFRDGLWWYTLAIPVLALTCLAGLVAMPFSPLPGAILAAMPPLLTLAYLTWSFRSFSRALPRWLARWIVIWPYSWGIVKGLTASLPRAIPNT